MACGNNRTPKTVAPKASTGRQLATNCYMLQETQPHSRELLEICTFRGSSIGAGPTTKPGAIKTNGPRD